MADAQVHFFGHSFFTKLIAQKPGLTLEAAQAQLGWELPAVAPEDLARQWVRELDTHGVAVAAIMASLPGEEAAVEAAARTFPDRLFPMAMVNPKGMPWPKQSSEAAPAAFANIRVACLFPAMHGYSIQDECVRPVLDWAQQFGRAIFVHCGVLSVGVRKKLGLPSPFDMRFSNPIDIHALALRYPEVPIIVPHFGAGYFREALMLADLCPNVLLDTSSSNGWMKYQPGLTTLTQVFRQALDVVGPQRLLFGTDSSFFPRGWQAGIFEAQCAALSELGVNAPDARAILGQNLLRIVGR